MRAHHLEQFAVGAGLAGGKAFCLGDGFLARRVLADLTDQCADLLGVGRRELLQPGRQRFVVGDQAVAPLFCQMQGQFFGGRTVFLHVERLANRSHLGFVELAHELADILHLTAFALKIGDALGFQDRVVQLFGQLEALEQVGAQRQQLAAEVLQLIALALEFGTGGTVGSLEFGFQLDVQFAAFSNEMTSHEIAFF